MWARNENSHRDSYAIRESTPLVSSVQCEPVAMVVRRYVLETYGSDIDVEATTSKP